MKKMLSIGFLLIAISSIVYGQAAEAIKREQKPMEAPKEAAALLAEFQKALKESDWQKALSLCTEEVKSKASGYESLEVFFKDVLPMKEICSKTEFRLQGQFRRGPVTKYMYPTDLKVPNATGSLEWALYAADKGGKCSIDFETKPLKIWVKHTILKQKSVNGLLRIDPNETQKGFDVKLIPLSEHYVIGKPMLFRIEMKNTSDITLGYIHTSFMVNDPLIVKEPTGKIVPYSDTSYQTSISPEFVEPGETVILGDNYDARSQYNIKESGTYTFQFKETMYMRASNTVSIEVMPGQFSPLESIVESFIPILPEGWKLMRNLAPAEKIGESTTEETVYVLLEGKKAKKAIDGDKGVNIVIVVISGDIPIKIQTHLNEMEFWGTCKLGRIYVTSYHAEELWPNYKEQIIKALKIEKEK